MKKYRTGLVVGKFCPLHKGHEYVITKAAQKCEQVIILSYTSSRFPFCSAENRKKWLENFINKPSLTNLANRFRIRVLNQDDNIFPNDDDSEEEHRKFCANYLLDDMDTTVQAVFSSESYGQGFADYLTQYFTARFLDPVVVDNVVVDIDRKKYPVSGTSLRGGGASNMGKFTSPFVRSFFLKKILFLGGESSGKTTICKQLAKRFCTTYVPEFGREWFDLRCGALHYEDMEYIAKTQIENEESIALHEGAWYSSDYLFCDTSALTTEFYSKKWFDRVSFNLGEMVDDSFERYDKIYVCAPDFPMVQDGTRQDEKFRKEGYQYAIDNLDSSGVGYSILVGSEEERFNRVVKDLS